MGKETAIKWTHHTFNPWWGCEKVSPGCANCYAEAFSRRCGFGDAKPALWGPRSVRRFFGNAHWAEPLDWNADAQAAGERRRVFCASMADVFEDRDDLIPHQHRLWGLIHNTPQLDWLLLTKRPEKIGARFVLPDVPNIWLGVSAEDQQQWNIRVPLLLAYGKSAAVRFVSMEPLLGGIDTNLAEINYDRMMWGPSATEPAINWIIVGGESGGKRRDCGVAAIIDAAEQGTKAGAAVFVKQDCARLPGQQGRIPDNIWSLKQFPKL